MNLTNEKPTVAPATTVATDPPVLDHERLDCYKVALEFAALVPELTRGARPSLRDQLERASSSVVLTFAEGCGRRSRRDRLHFFAIAQGSAMECAAAVDLLRVTGQVSPAAASSAKHLIARIVRMLVGLRRH